MTLRVLVLCAMVAIEAAVCLALANPAVSDPRPYIARKKWESDPTPENYAAIEEAIDEQRRWVNSVYRNARIFGVIAFVSMAVPTFAIWRRLTVAKLRAIAAK